MMGIIKQVAPTSQCKDDKCLGVSDFLQDYYPSSEGNVLLDTSLTFYAALGGRTITRQLGWKVLNPFYLYPLLKNIGKRFTEKGVKDSNYAGEGLTQGGVIVFDKGGKAIYSYLEVTGEDVPVEEIAQAIRAMKGGQ